MKQRIKKIIAFFNILPFLSLDFLKSTIFKNIAMLFSSSTIAQMLPVLISPIVARLYNPNDYALLAAFSSITIITTILSTGMYDVAIVLDKDDESAMNTAAASLIFTLSFTLLTAIVILIFSHLIVRIIHNKDIVHYLWLVPVSIISTGLYKILNMWTNRKKRFPRISLNRIYMSILSSFFLLFFGYFRLGGLGLVYGVVLSQFVITLILLTQTIVDDKSLFGSVTTARIRISFIHHRHFLFFNLPQAFLDGFRESSIIIIISNCFGQVILGSFTFAYNILSKCVRFSGESIGQIYYQRASERINTNKSNKDIFRVTSLSLMAISLPIFTIFAIWGHNIFQFVFGEVWIQAGYLTQILALLFFLRFVISPISSTPIIYNRQKQFLIISIIYNVIPPVVLYVAANIFKVNIYYSVLSFVMVSSLSLMILLFWFRQLTKIQPICE